MAALSKADALLAKYKSQPKTKITAESLERKAKSARAGEKKGKNPALRVDVDRADRHRGSTMKGKGKGSSSALGYTSLSDEEPVAASPVLGGAFQLLHPGHVGGLSIFTAKLILPPDSGRNWLRLAGNVFCLLGPQALADV